VVEAEHGRAALERLAESLPSLILLDLVMPEMDGFEFLDECRKSPQWQNIPVVILTAVEVTEADRQRLDGHVQAILQKGAVSQEELLGFVKGALRGRTEKPPAA
jgi:CheY-like chemotaxis protein